MGSFINHVDSLGGREVSQMSTLLYNPYIVKWSMNGGVSRGGVKILKKNSYTSYYHISLVVVMCAAMRGLLLM